MKHGASHSKQCVNLVPNKTGGDRKLVPNKTGGDRLKIFGGKTKFRVDKVIFEYAWICLHDKLVMINKGL